MTHERSDRAGDAACESSQKFDYFMVGLAGALTAYLGKDLRLTPLGMNSSTLDLSTVLFFALSMLVGIKRCEWFVTALNTGHMKLYHGESAGELRSASQNPRPALNQLTGDVLGSSEAGARAVQHARASTELGKSEAKWARKAETAYRWRNRLFVLGIVALAASRIVGAYGK